jgi:hypothetical protein
MDLIMKKILIAFLSIVSLSPLLGNNINWSFPPATLSSTSFNASDAHVAMDASGDLIAVWVENGLVRASTKSINLAWTSEVTLSNSGATSPRVVADSNGNGTAVWLENGVVKASSKPFSGSWSSAVALSATNASTPTLAVDSSGDVVAVWARAGNVETSTKLFGGSWQSVAVLDSSLAAAPHIAIGGPGASARVVVVWYGSVNGTTIVYSQSKLISGGWSARQTLSSTAFNAAYPNVAVDQKGNAVAVWYQYGTTNSLFSNVVVQSAAMPSGGSWSVPVTLSAPGVRNPSTLVARVGFDSVGNAVAIWNQSFDDETFNIESALRPFNGDWTAPVELVTSNLYAYDVDLAVTSFGDALTAFMFYNGSSLIIQSAESNVTGFMQNVWSVPGNLSSGRGNAFPRVAAVLTGNTVNAAAVWINYNGTKTIVQALTGTKSIVLPPSNLSVMQSANSGFGVFTEYVNTVNWNASTDPNLAGYLIYRNGMFVAEVGVVTQFIDDNQFQNGAVTYGVAAVNTQQSQSVTMTVNFP